MGRASSYGGDAGPVRRCIVAAGPAGAREIPAVCKDFTPALRRAWVGAAAAWRKGDALTLNLLPQQPEAQAGVMVVEAQADPALPVGYVQPAEPE